MGLEVETPSIRFPLLGTWLVLNPPGHPRHAYDISVIRFDGLFAVLAHLQRGSVSVAEGDSVKIGQPLGVVGNSGNTLAPPSTST